LVAPDVSIKVRTENRFVSRGGTKLDGALAALDVPVAGLRWLDAGASTGGFTDRLLQGGAAAVAAVDVGYGQLDWSLRNDDRVVVLERTNIRTLEATDLPWVPDAVVADLSFISLRLVLPALTEVVSPSGALLLMVKPQFEVGRDAVGKGGVVRDPNLWTAAVEGVVEAAEELGWGLVGTAPSRLPGPSGNREFFIHLVRGADSDRASIVRAVKEATG
jgi:23S rRNA (cytidine1920-2'-O)/16S rRNA (cytidine1409-2'-O)-methyltransferase